MTRYLLFTFFLLLNETFAQPCVKIESILVTACTSAPNTEGSNEMMRFRIGNTPLNTANMNIIWGSGQYTYAGLAQNATTANIVAQLNSTIQSCGYLVEPINGILPANKQVLIICGLNTSTTANSFADLSDTLIVIFQNSTNPGGHFLNYNPNPPFPQTIDQTTTISFNNIAGCSSSATYFRNQLINVFGVIPPATQTIEERGATVIFDENMNPTYINNGCVASVEVINPNWDAPPVFCSNSEPINLNTLITGTTGGFWTGTGITDSIFDPTGLSGNISITYSVVNQVCNDTLSRTQIIEVIPQPIADFTLPETICIYNQPLDLNALVTGTTGGIFSGTNISFNTFNPAGLEGNYEITYSIGSGTCSDSITKTITVISLPVPEFSQEIITYCVGENTEEIIVTNAGGLTTNWYADPAYTDLVNTGTSYSPPSNQSQMYYVTFTQEACVSDPGTFMVEVYFIEAILEADADNEISPFDLIAFNQSANAETCVWFLNDEPFDYNAGETYTIDEAGEYTLKLVCTNAQGCESADEITFTVIDNNVELVIPNVFTPNGDGNNDLFTFKANGIKTMAGKIFNRWGKIVYEWEGVQSYWDGTINNSDAPAGVYFYIVETTDIFNIAKENKGTVTLVR